MFFRHPLVLPAHRLLTPEPLIYRRTPSRRRKACALLALSVALTATGAIRSYAQNASADPLVVAEMKRDKPASGPVFTDRTDRTTGED